VEERRCHPPPGVAATGSGTPAQQRTCSRPLPVQKLVLQSGKARTKLRTSMHGREAAFITCKQCCGSNMQENNTGTVLFFIYSEIYIKLTKK
jgi:hypothetical protein